MKKLKKLLAVLMASTALMASSMPAYAIEHEMESDANIIDMYIKTNDVYAWCRYFGYSGPDAEDRIEIEYLNEGSKKAVESCIGTMDTDQSKITLTEMSDEEKFSYIYNKQIKRFLSNNKLSCKVTEKNGEEIEILYYAEHKDDKAKIEDFIKEHGFDKIVTVTYTMMGDPTVKHITDIKTICSKLDEYINKNSLNAYVYISENTYVQVVVGEFGDPDKEYQETERLIKDYMIKNDLDPTNTYFAWLQNEFEGDEGGYTAADTNILGDANSDGELSVRDCACIARKAAKGQASKLPKSADYNKDGKKNIRDAAAIARQLAPRG